MWKTALGNVRLRLTSAVRFALLGSLAASSGLAQERAVVLGRGDITSIKPLPDVTRQVFERESGEFEVVIPSTRFPLPAPSCRKTVTLRMPPASESGDRVRQLESRWRIFQSLQALAHDPNRRVALKLDLSGQATPGKSGQGSLEYCEAFIHVPAAR